jgi:hypothetical protein
VKIIKYILLRILFFTVPILIFYFGAYYTLPKHIQEDGFCFMAEIDRFLEVSLIFSIIFLIYLCFEAFKFNNRKQVNLRNVALILSMFVISVVVFLIYSNFKY